MPKKEASAQFETARNSDDIDLSESGLSCRFKIPSCSHSKDPSSPRIRTKRDFRRVDKYPTQVVLDSFVMTERIKYPLHFYHVSGQQYGFFSWNSSAYMLYTGGFPLVVLLFF